MKQKCTFSYIEKIRKETKMGNSWALEGCGKWKGAGRNKD